MGLPDIIIQFQKTAVARIAAGTGGVVGIILKDTKWNGAHVIRDVTGIDEELSTANKDYITRALMGEPSSVVVYVLPSTATNYTDALTYFANKRVNYICGDPEITNELATALTTWVIAKRNAGKIRPVAVVPGVASDNEGVVNFCLVGASDTVAAEISVGTTKYTTAQYCSRIAGLLAGLSYNESATFRVLTEVTGIPQVADDDTVDTAINAGKFVLYDNGTQIVVGRGVNSLTTTTAEKTEDLKKIKIVAIQDQITLDLMDTINENYVGKYPNSYDNKCLLVTAIGGYLATLEQEGWIERDKSTVEINVEKQRAYLQSTGVDTSDMDDQAVKEANTGSKVFIKASVSILDAIEDVDIVIEKQ